ncbi:MAG: hypothetical protein WBM75_15110 [Polyangiales bacterium]
MPLHLVWLAASLVLTANVARAQEPCSERIQGAVPEGIAEIEVRHDNLSSENILDWRLDDPNGSRGWGGGKGDPAERQLVFFRRRRT